MMTELLIGFAAAFMASLIGVPVLLVWSRRTWRCRQHSCPQISWGETTQLAPPRKHFTTRAITWAVDQLLTRDVVVSALARDLQVGWRTLWKAIEGPLQERLKEIRDRARVEALGLDEHVWRHSGPHKNRMITGVVEPLAFNCLRKVIPSISGIP